MTPLEQHLLSDEAEPGFPGQNYPVVLSPATAGPFTDVLGELSHRKSELMKTLHESGAILLRNCGVDHIADFHQTLETIGIRPAAPQEYYGEVVREQIETLSREVTLIENDGVVLPHTEAYYWYRQPKHIAFYCQQADEMYGETPLFDCAAIADDVPSPLLARLRHAKVSMQYIFGSDTCAETTTSKHGKNTWQRIFNTSDRQEAEKQLNRDDIDFEWLRNDELLLTTRIDLLSTHPETGRLCFRGVRYPSSANHEFMLKKFIEPRLGPKAYLTRSARFMRLKRKFDFGPMDLRRYFWTDSIPGAGLSSDEERLLTEVYFQNCSIFRWRRGDMLLIDNLRMAHARLNVGPERRLAIFIGEYSDQKSLFN